MRINYFFVEEKTKNEITEIAALAANKTPIVEIAIVYFEQDDPSIRLTLRKIITQNQTIPVILVSNTHDLASLAWESGVDGFVNFSGLDWQSQMLYFFSKVSKTDANPVVPFNSTNRLDLVRPAQILYLIAERNYTKIFFENKTSITISRNLKEVGSKFIEFRYLQRFGKSFIINLNKISSIDKNMVYFGSDIKIMFPKYGKGLQVLKNRLIWQ